MNSVRHTFPKAEKLKSRKQIDLLFQGGKSFIAAPVKCYYRVDELTSLAIDELIDVKTETANIQSHEFVHGKHQTSNIKRQTSNVKRQTSNLLAGVSVSKRNFKHSVDRNRIKRLLREAYRLHKYTLLEKLQTQNKSLEVFFVFTDKTLPDFAVVEDKMKYCIRRLGKIVEGGV
jgi:ribonuclease P protein component